MVKSKKVHNTQFDAKPFRFISIFKYRKKLQIEIYMQYIITIIILLTTVITQLIFEQQSAFGYIFMRIFSLGTEKGKANFLLVIVAQAAIGGGKYNTEEKKNLTL